MTDRTYPRFPTEIPVSVEVSGGVIEMQAVNISRAGLLLAGTEALTVGLTLILRFTLTREIELQGVVRHQVHGCGVQFVAVPPDEQVKLNAYLDTLASMVAKAVADV